MKKKLIIAGISVLIFTLVLISALFIYINTNYPIFEASAKSVQGTKAGIKGNFGETFFRSMHLLCGIITANRGQVGAKGNL